MNPRFYADGLDIEGRCFFSPWLSRDLETSPPKTEWQAWEQCLNRLIRGDFEAIFRLIEVQLNYESNVLRYSASLLLECAITWQGVSYLREQLVGERDPLLLKEYAGILAATGCLSFVPEILRVYGDLRSFSESESITVRLSDMLESEPGEICLPPPTLSRRSYDKLVMNRAADVGAAVGDTSALVYRGKLWSVDNLSKIMLQQISTSEFGSETRLMFEAATGINCSEFFDDQRRFRPLTAAALLESFREGPDAAKFKSGARYFFAQPIPWRSGV